MPDSGMPKPYISVDELISRISKYHPDDDMDLVRRAYQFAENAHANQFRKSGDPYFSHPCAVAVILSDLMLDATTIAAGLLHDCVEDVEGVTLQTIGEQFGGFDLALMENGQYDRQWHRIHMLPDETAQAAADLQARYVLPAHNSKFSLARHKWQAPLQDLTAASRGAAWRLLTPEIGEKISLWSPNGGSEWWNRSV